MHMLVNFHVIRSLPYKTLVRLYCIGDSPATNSLSRGGLRRKPTGPSAATNSIRNGLAGIHRKESGRAFMSNTMAPPTITFSSSLLRSPATVRIRLATARACRRSAVGDRLLCTPKALHSIAQGRGTAAHLGLCSPGKVFTPKVLHRIVRAALSCVAPSA